MGGQRSPSSGNHGAIYACRALMVAHANPDVRKVYQGV